ncbi:MAG TPA: type II secretion system F family protein [Micropepsaceae bacterium]|nr:type II secretion system F family protein [Micropepsaceae bacterium]
MTGSLVYIMVGVLTFFAIGGVAFAFAGGASGKAKKRMAAVARPAASARALKGAADSNQQRRKNVQAMLKELEAQNAAKKKRISLRRRIEQAGLEIEPRTYWIMSVIAGALAAVVALLMTKAWYAAPLAGFAVTFGIPRWVLAFLKARREKAFTREFAPAIDTIVRSVKSGLPVNEALKVLATEMQEPVRGEFKLLNESLKVGVTMEDGLKRMYERMPTPEVNFFGIVMTIQQKSGGNLSEALGNLSGVLRDRKRLQGKIRAMSSEARAGALIIGSLPPGVTMLIYITTPSYIEPLFTVELGNLMLMGCAVWMSLGIFMMKKMVSFKY